MPPVLRTKKYGEDAPEMADLYFSYGRALLENAISVASVLGKEAEPAPVDDEKREQHNACILLLPLNLKPWCSHTIQRKRSYFVILG